MRIKHAAERLDDLRPLAERLAHFRIGQHVGVALAIADLYVLESVPLFGHRTQSLGEQAEILDGEGELAALRAEGHAHDAEEIPRVNPLLEEGVLFLAQHVELETELDVVVFIDEICEGGFAVTAQQHHAAGGLDLLRAPLVFLELVVIFYHIA